MRDEVYIGSSPPEEGCAQVGSDNYMATAREECRRYVALLRRYFGEEPPEAQLVIRSNPHDFGSYLSVNCIYDCTTGPESYAYALACEDYGPETWECEEGGGREAFQALLSEMKEGESE